MSYEGPVRKSRELERVLGLPRRELDFASREVAELAWSWSPQLLNDAGKREWARVTALPDVQRDAELARFASPRAEGGEGCPLLMLPAQAVMLYEAFHCKGLFASAAVGAGKTLVAWLLALIFGAPRPLLLVPGGLETKTHDEFADLARYWLAPRPAPQVVSYETLGNPKNEFLLCNCPACYPCEKNAQPPRRCACEACMGRPGGIRPTHIVADESDKLRNPAAAVTRRVSRYMVRHPETVYCGMTGTAWRKSIRNSAPQLIWALKWQAPVPLTYVDMQEWSEALDFSTRDKRRDPGALCLLAGIDPKEIETYAERLELAADGFKRRLLETLGVVQTEGQSCDQPLSIRFLKAPDDPALDEAFRHFRVTQTTLDGWDIDDPLSALRYGTEMSCGFFYYWDPRPPQYWIESRSAASKRIREKIDASSHSGRPLDTKAQVYKLFPDDPILLDWKETEPTFVPNTVARPITATVLGYAVAWIKANGPALIWVQHDYVGQALSAMSGVPYFGSKGRDASGRYIMKHSPKQSAIVSLRANSRGRNLQAWNRNLVVGPPQAATDWEQGICGRTHRNGQKKPVFIDVLLSCAENVHAVNMAYAEAAWVRSRGGAMGKLLIASYDWSHFPAAELAALPLNHPSRPRWVRPNSASNSLARV
jgi:hypothetical protein